MTDQRATGSLLQALVERWFDIDEDHHEPPTEEQVLARIEDLVGEGWYHAGKELERAERLEKQLLHAYLAGIYTPEGVTIWLADAEKKGQSIREQLQRAEQLVTGAYV